MKDNKKIILIGSLALLNSVLSIFFAMPHLSIYEGWLPILDYRTGDNICFDAVGGGSGYSGQVIDYRHERLGEHSTMFADVESLLETYVAALERGLFKFDGYGIEYCDDDTWKAFRDERRIFFDPRRDHQQRYGKQQTRHHVGRQS